MPSGSVSPVTRPKRVSTPTLPVGIEFVLHINNKITTITMTICKMREPASRIFGICGNELPKSPPPPRVTFAMTASCGTGDSAASRAHTACDETLLRPCDRALRRPRRVYHLLRAAPEQAYPNILWSFFLTPRRACATIRANSCPSQGNSGLATGRRRKGAIASEGKRHAVFARLHRAMHQSAVRSTRPLAARRRDPGIQRRRPLPLLRRFPAQRPAAARPALPHAPASADGAPATAAPPALIASTRRCVK